MKVLKNHYKISAVLVFMTLFMSVSSVQVNEEVELDQFMNARYSADFTKNADNLRAVLPKGTKAIVKEVKKFASGNSGVFIQVEDGALKDQKVWVHFDPKKPSLKLYNANASVVTNPRNASNATATRDVPVVRDPAGTPAPVITTPPPVVTTPPINGSSLPGLIDAANRGVSTMTPDGTAGCAACAAAAANGPPPVSTLVSTAEQAAGIANFFTGSDSVIQNSGSMNAEKLKAARFVALRSHLTNFVSYCSKYNPSGDYDNKLITKWNSMVSFLKQQQSVLGGDDAADTLLTSYANTVSL
ncbi:MAG: hypothetical protein ACXVAX_12580, partial [Pseudobdellovibrio sp.]